MTAPLAPLTELGYASDSASWWSALTEETTPELVWPAAVAVYDRMRRQDGQVRSVLRAVTLPVLSTAWRVHPGGARDEVVELVARDLGLPVAGGPEDDPGRGRDRFSWGRHLHNALLMLAFGHMYFEQVYRLDDRGRARLRKLAPRPPRSLTAINVARDGGLESIEQAAPAALLTRSPTVKIPVSRLVGYVNEQEGGNWHGTSLLRPAYKHWLIKDRLLRVDATTIERNGMGVPLYKGAEGEENLDKGLEMAKSWRSGEAAGAAVPNTADLLLRGVDGDLPNALASIRYHDEQIGKSALTHFLNLGTQTGSWALGTAFADFFVLSLQTVAQNVADVATHHVVEDLVDVNFGAEEPAPRVVFDEIGSHQAATAQAIKLLVEAGILRPDRTLEEAARQQFGLPPKDTPSSPAPTTEES